MSDLIQASLTEIRARLAGGDVSAEAVAKACLDRIAETEPSIPCPDHRARAGP